MEFEQDNQDASKSNRSQVLKPGLRKLPANHRSVDDMEFDDPDYAQLKVRDELKHKHKLLREDNERAEVEEKLKLKELEEAKLQLPVDEEEEEESGSSEDDSDTDELSEKSVETGAAFLDEKWISQFESACNKLNKKLIDLAQFEKSVRALMVHLDPSKDEKNKERLCALTEHLV